MQTHGILSEDHLKADLCGLLYYQEYSTYIYSLGRVEIIDYKQFIRMMACVTKISQFYRRFDFVWDQREHRLSYGKIKEDQKPPVRLNQTAIKTYSIRLNQTVIKKVFIKEKSV